jgi:hypothetical protein
MSRPRHEMADVVRRYQSDFVAVRGGKVCVADRKVLHDIAMCRTASLGGHRYRCTNCSHEEISYNSCRNRHCPKCQAAARTEWLNKRQAELLPVQYFHVVFSVPKEIAAIAFQNKAKVYGILFRAVSETLREIAASDAHLGGEIGVLAILHTWGQNLQHHPHIHCVVPGGAIAPDGKRWISCRQGFFVPVRVLSRLFRGKFLGLLKGAAKRGELQFHGQLVSLAIRNEFDRYLRPLYKRNWFVYSKRPFGGPAHVLKYLARYTHRTAISNHRLVAVDNGKVAFTWRDYAHGSKRGILNLSATEFLRRFLLHVLPKGFVRIRHYGFMANRKRISKLELCRTLLHADSNRFASSEPQHESSARDPVHLISCPKCEEGRLVIVAEIDPQFFFPKCRSPNRVA